MLREEVKVLREEVKVLKEEVKVLREEVKVLKEKLKSELLSDIIIGQLAYSLERALI